MAGGDDKPRGRGSGDEDRPSSKRAGDEDRPSSKRVDRASGLAKRPDPFDEGSPAVSDPPRSTAGGSRSTKRAAPSDEPEAGAGDHRAARRRRITPLPESPRRRRRASASLPEDEPADDELAADEPADEAPAPARRSRFSLRRRPSEEDVGRREAGRDVDAPEDDDLADLPAPPRLRRPPWWILVGGLVLVLIVGGALYGEFNTERFFLVCSGSKAEAHRGRGFPWPFGHQPLMGSQYRPVHLGGDAQCQTAELGSEAELRHALLKLVLGEAERLSHKTRSEDLAQARRLISQGLLLAQSYKKERARLEALRATLDFQRARVVMRELETTLTEARRLFARARTQSKQHRREATAWMRLLDHMLDGLRRRIAGDPQPPRRVGAPPTPVTQAGTPTDKPAGKPGEPSRPAPPVPGGEPPGSARPAPGPPPRPATPAAPDAGVSGGGILL